MRQEVNLLNNLNMPRVLYFSARWIFNVSILWILLLLIVLSVVALDDAKQSAILTRMNFEQRILSRQLETLNLYNKKDVSSGNNAAGSESKQPGFAQYLEELAKNTPDGIWLGYIMLVPEKNHYVLTGNVLHKKTVSRFIDVLADNYLFIGDKFDTVRLARNRNDKFYSFTLSTEKKRH